MNIETFPTERCCPLCSYPLEAHTKAAGKSTLPIPGALSICFNCQGICVFNEDPEAWPAVEYIICLIQEIRSK
jgi:hypothetical protein